MGYDPTQAGDPIPRKFKNVMRCTVNEIITGAEAAARNRWFQGLPEGMGESEPYWDFYFEALDAKWLRDGSALSWKAAGRLYTKEGKKQDNTAKPYRVSMGFAGLVPPVSVFPGDPEGKHNAYCASVNDEPIGENPNYDASRILGRVFLCEIEVVEFGTDMPLPVVAYPEGYVFTDKVRELGSSTGGDVNADGAAAPATNTLVDVFTADGAEVLKQILGALDGQTTDADMFDLLKAAGVDSRAMIDGESAIGVAFNEGALVAKLTEHGNITVTDGRIAVSSS